ncbi:MAG: S49 family peptidase, partial [Pseudomonas sp.]
GEQAVRLGLIDGLGSLDSVARDVIGQEVIVDFTEQESTIDRLAKRVGAGVSEQVALRLGLSASPMLR